MPSCTPAGISSVTVSSPYTLPSPLQVPHLAVMVVPSPLQVGQAVTVCICPRKVLLTRFTWPLPPQVEQVCMLLLSLAPLPPQVWHTTYFFTFTLRVTPLAISSYDSFSFIRRLLPRTPRLLPPRPEERPP